MIDMSKKRPPAEQQPAPEDPSPKKSRPPSRENTRYLALPLDMYEALERYARAKSDEDTTHSISWAGRRLLRRALEAEGFWPPPAPPEGEGEGE